MLVIAGVDEAGRGPLAGEVTAAAVILSAQQSVTELKDSKKLSAKQRSILAVQIKQQAVSFCIASASVAEIDQLNIHQATLLAMQRAVEGLSIVPKQVLVDGKFCPTLNMPCQAIIKGDNLHACISAASILAKVYRDQLMIDYDQQFPGYGFAQHKGYPTPKHKQVLQDKGPCAIHRRTFSPVKYLI